MKAIPTRLSAVLACVGATLGSCANFHRAALVPDMPYKPRARAVAAAPLPMAPTPAVADATAVPPGAVPASMLPAVTPPKPATPVVAATTGNRITQPAAPVAPKPAAPKPAAPKPVTVTPPPAPATPAPAPEQPALISNDGPIPVATRVPGDPLRVYNPLDPSLTIKITDKNGNPQPSGKKLRVPKTNFYFYVP